MTTPIIFRPWRATAAMQVDRPSPQTNITEKIIRAHSENLIRLFFGLSCLATLLVLVLAGVGLNRVLSNMVIKLAENEAVAVSQSILRLEGFLLVNQNRRGEEELTLPHSRLQQFDQRMKNLLSPFDILKIKVFSPEWMILYSTDHQIIGQIDFGNQRLNNALAGNNDSRLETKEMVLDLDLEEKFNVDVVEAYIPIRSHQGKVIGSFEIYRDVTPYREEILEAVITSILLLGILLAFALAAAGNVFSRKIRAMQKLLNRMSDLTSVDPLTGLTDRLHAIEHAETEMARYLHQEPSRRQVFSLVMVDIDHFKGFNEIHGMAIGDQILRLTGELLDSLRRPFDFIGRWGGDRFFLLFPDCNSQQALTRAEEIRKSVENAPFEVDGGMHKVTVSIGIGSAQISDTQMNEVLKRADLALYAAKQSGRNRSISQQTMPANSAHLDEGKLS